MAEKIQNRLKYANDEWKYYTHAKQKKGWRSFVNCDWIHTENVAAANRFSRRPSSDLTISQTQLSHSGNSKDETKNCH